MTAAEMEVENGVAEAMDIPSGSSESESDSGEEETENLSQPGQMDEGSDQENEEKASNPAFSKFMQGFWDLASVDVPVRVGAAGMIVRHVSDAGGDAGYAVKRLVRGMCSSRESARQGFASCLAQVLATLPEDEPATSAVLEQILKATQTTSAMKGADERELVLGRLLGVSALALSGRLESDSTSAESALKAVAELFNKRKWLGQAAGEATLLVLSKAFLVKGEFATMALPLVVPLLKGKDKGNLQLSELSPDQLLLALGLRSIMRERGLDPQEDAGLKQSLPAYMRHASVVRLGKAQDLMPALKQSASVFPKVHSVWGRLWDDLGLSPTGQPRASLSAKRLKKLGEVWSVVVDGALTTTSLNNKGTAILLLKEVLQRVPAAGVWHVLSPGIVRLMLNHTKGEENYLFSLVRMTLEQLPTLAKDDSQVQAQLAACLLRRGTIRFDSRAGINVVSSLVKRMGQEALDSHVEFLKGVVRGKPGWGDGQDSLANGDSSAVSVEPATVTAEGTPADDTDEAIDGSAAERLQAVEALYSLARSSNSGGSKEKGGGDARSRALAAVAAGSMQVQGERLTKTAMFFLETGFFEPVDGASPLSPKMLELCRSKFFSLVADIAAKPLFWGTADATATPDAKVSSKKSPSKKNRSPSGEGPAWGALEALWGLHEAWQGLEGGGRKLIKGVSVGAEERDVCSVALAVVGKIRGGDARGDKFGAAFAGILLMVSLHFLEGSEDDGRRQERCQHITDLVETYGRMSGTVTGEDGDDEDSDDENDPDPLAILADVLVAVVAEPSRHSVRGLRDTARRVWGIVCGMRALTPSALDTLLAVVCGEDDANASQGADDDDSEEEDDENDDENDDEIDDENDDKNDDKQEKLGGKVKGKATKEDDSGTSDDSDDEEDEVMVHPSDLEGLLGGNEDSEDEGLQHHAGADRALEALLGLKKSGRKKGTLEAQRQGYQIRLRALDLLEVACSRHVDSPYLLSGLLPILKSIEKLDGSASVGNRTGGEATALSKRLQTLYKGRLCKCKPRALDGEGSVAEGTEEDKQDFFAGIARSFSELIGLCRTWAKDTALSSLALEGALCCLRSLKGRPAKGKSGARKTSNGDDEALDGALHALSDAVTDFFGKRRGGGFSPVQVEDVVRRFPEVLVPVLVKAAEGAAASDFLRTEAFRLLSGILQRRAMMDVAAREVLVSHCPAIFKALGDVFASAAAEAATASAATDAGEKSAEADAPPAEKGAAKTTNASKSKLNTASSTMLKAKRLKPLLGCLSATISADEGVGSLNALSAEARSLRVALNVVGDASASLAMQLLCGEVANELDAIATTAEEDVDMKTEGKVKKIKSKSSPKTKRKVDDVGSPLAVASEAGLEKVRSSSKKTKRRRESKEA